jgi:hypothetical protein
MSRCRDRKVLGEERTKKYTHKLISMCKGLIFEKLIVTQFVNKFHHLHVNG